VLPPVINEQDISPFKFWFDDSIQDGLYYQRELYYRRHIGDVRHRAKIYHYACKLAHRAGIVVTITRRQCSIWVSLRGEKPGDVVRDPLLSFVEPFLTAKQTKPAPED
jgi:hypothetical protein